MLGSPVDAVLVFSVLTGNSILAATQRLRAENRLNVLLEQQIPPARKVETGPDGARVYTDVIAAQLRPGADVSRLRAAVLLLARDFPAALAAYDDVVSVPGERRP